MGERIREGEEEEEEERESGGCSSKGENAGTRKKKTERSEKNNKHIDCVMTRVESMASKFRAKSSTFHYALISRDSRETSSLVGSLARGLRCNGICMSRALIRTRTLLTRCKETRKARKIIGVLARSR